MAVLLIAGTTLAGVAFMAIFFVAIYKEGGRMKICQVLKVDTELSSDSRLSRETESVEQLAESFQQADGTAKVLLMGSGSKTSGRPKDNRERKPA
jgi:hypothetical protein